MTGGVQLPLFAAGAALPLDPTELAGLCFFKRIDLYNEFALLPWQREAEEEAVRLVLAGQYGRSA